MLLLAEGKEPELTLEQLYQIKGQAVTQIEIAQNTLKFANEKISEVLSKAEKKEDSKKEEKQVKSESK
jgi:regulator of replication initiation timing